MTDPIQIGIIGALAVAVGFFVGHAVGFNDGFGAGRAIVRQVGTVDRDAAPGECPFCAGDPADIPADERCSLHQGVTYADG